MSLYRWFRTLPLRIRSLVGRARLDRELDEELRHHLETLTANHVEHGLPPEEARFAALRAMGSLTLRTEQCRDARRVGAIEDLGRDVRFAVRMLRRSPGFTIAAVLSLALGIGANAAIFQLLDAVRLRTLPVRDPHQLAEIRIRNWDWPPGSYSGRYAGLTYPLWDRLRTNQRAFSSIAAWGNGTVDLSARGESRFAENALWVSGGFFETLGVTAALGRVLTPADDVRGCAAPGVVLSHAFWQREFSASRSIVGRSVTLNGRPFSVIGVTGPEFFGVEVGRHFDLAVPLCADPLINSGRSRLERRSEWWLAAFGRLQPGWSIDRASAHVAALSRPLFEETLPDSFNANGRRRYLSYTLHAASAASGYSQLREQYERPLWLLLGAAAVVLLIACANVAGLLLTRAGARQREVAVRLALGASRARVARQLFVESCVLAAFGTASAAWLAPAVGRSVVAMISAPEAPLFVRLAIDWRLVAFAAGLALATCTVFGLGPALRATAVSPEVALRAGRRVTGGPARLRARRTLVVVQVALTVMLLANAFLFVRTLRNLTTTNVGFRQEDILEVDVDLSRVPPDALAAVRARIVDEIQTIPGVEGAATASIVPMVGRWNKTIYLRDASQPVGMASFSRVSAGYFSTMGIAHVAGRTFDARETAASPDVAIVNRAFVRRFLNGANAVGTPFRLEGDRGEPDQPFEIVGVVENTKYGSLREEAPPIVYLAAEQADRVSPFVQTLIHSTRDSAALAAVIGKAIAAAHPAASFHFHDFQAQVRHTILRERLVAMLCGFFAALAAVLATIGVYGLIASSVAQRTTEIGVRLALGADRTAIVTMFLREAGVLIAAGLAIGVALARASGDAAATLLFDVEPGDPATLAATAAVLGAAAVLASYVPARIASRSNPTVALRAE